MNRLQIRGARVIDPGTDRDEIVDVLIEQGRISRIGGPAEADARIIDATGQWLVPGIIDLAARLGEPGPPQPATIASELTAAARSGITRLCLPPDTDPVIDAPSVVEWIEERAAQADGAQLCVLGALTKGLHGDSLSDMATLRDSGCVGLGHGDTAIDDSAMLRNALSYAADCGITVHLRPVDWSLAASGLIHEGALSSRLGLPGVPSSAETVGLARLLELSAETGVRLHLARLSTGAAVEMVARAKQRGLNITADVAVHQLALSCEDISGFDSNYLVQPPLRTPADREALCRGVADGIIDAVCSNHHPLGPDDKDQPLPSARPGVSALDLLVPGCLSLLEQHQLSAADLVRVLHTAPAKILGLGESGLREGEDAVLSLIDPEITWTLDENSVNSRCLNSPLAGRQLQGRATGSIIGDRCFLTD